MRGRGVHPSVCESDRLSLCPSVRRPVRYHIRTQVDKPPRGLRGTSFKSFLHSRFQQRIKYSFKVTLDFRENGLRR